MKRPLLITVIAIFAIISGILSLLGGFGIGTISVFSTIKSGETAVNFGMQFFAILQIVGGILSIAYGMGLWKLKTWAWWVAVFVNVLLAVTQLLNSPANDNPNNTYTHWSIVVVYGLILLYLVSKNVRNAFGINGSK